MREGEFFRAQVTKAIDGVERRIDRLGEHEVCHVGHECTFGQTEPCQAFVAKRHGFFIEVEPRNGKAPLRQPVH